MIDLSIASNFAERGAAILSAATMIPIISDAEMAQVQYAILLLGKPILESVTPVLTGRLQASTEEGGYISRVGGQYQVIYEQPAENEAGQHYAGYVVMGHMAGETFVPPNPYPVQAMAEIYPMAQVLLRAAGRRIASRVAVLMAGGTADMGAV